MIEFFDKNKIISEADTIEMGFAINEYDESVRLINLHSEHVAIFAKDGVLETTDMGEVELSLAIDCVERMRGEKI